MTHCDRVLALLSDGQPHDHHSLYALNVIAHSRVSELRKRGHTIEMWREDDLYMYRLCSEEPCAPSPPPRRGSLTEPDAASPPSEVSSGQLSLATGYEIREGSRMLAERFAA